MLLKFKKVISVSSEHPSYPASNLLEYPSKNSWRCAKPNELIATVILELADPACITGVDIGNYHSCIVVVEASTSEEPDKWIPIINHQFMTHDEAVNNKFRDQVQLFTKKELNPENVKIKFDRVKVTCMQSSNPRELFGLHFITLRTEVTVDLGLDIFGRFKLKEPNNDEFKEKYLKLFKNEPKNYKDQLKEKIITNGVINYSKKQEEDREHKKKPHLEKLQTNTKTDSDKTSSFINQTPPPAVPRTLFGDIITSPKPKAGNSQIKKDTEIKKRPLSPQNTFNAKDPSISMNKRPCCSVCKTKPLNQLCQACKLLSDTQKNDSNSHSIKKKAKKNKKPFNKLFEDVSFALSGYVNPQRDEIRSKALKMGAKFIANPDTVNNKCTHLICAFKNTPKSQQLKGHCKIVGHKFVEDCFNNKKRIPWRRYAVNDQDKKNQDSEEEIEASSSNPYDQETDESDGS